MNKPAPVTPLIFVRGIMPRSGTNFLADVLACHADVQRFPGNFWEFPPFRFQGDLDHYLQRIAASGHAPDFRPGEFLPHLGAAWTHYLSPSLLPDQFAVFKEPSVDHLEAMFTMFPQAKVLVILREGRDLVESLLRAGFAFPKMQLTNPRHWRRLLPDEEFRIVCRQLKQAADKLNQFQKSAAGKSFASQLKVVHFETLLASPEDLLHEILPWCGLSMEGFDWKAFERLPVRGSSFLRNEDGSMNFAEGLPKSEAFNPVGRWASWSKRRKSYYQQTTGLALQPFGYHGGASA